MEDERMRIDTIEPFISSSVRSQRGLPWEGEIAREGMKVRIERSPALWRRNLRGKGRHLALTVQTAGRRSGGRKILAK